MVPFIVLSILCYLIALFMLRKKPLALLKEGSHLKVNFLSKMMNWLTKFLPFKQRFKYSLASRSIGKLFIVSITSFGAGMLIVLTLIGMNLFKGTIEHSFEGMKYDYLVYMNNFYHEKTSELEDYVLSSSFKIKEIQNKDGKKVLKENLKDDTEVTMTGIDQDSKYIELLDEEKEDIKPLLKENKMIISKNMKEYLELEIGEKIVFENNNEMYTYEIVGISNELMSFNAYLDREAFSKDLGFNEKQYNVIYSKDDKYQNMSKLEEDELSKIIYVMSLTDLKDNILKQMERYNTSIYIVIGFASVMSFIIIAVIASIIVEENKKTISLMKVMGYRNKEVSNIVLNIYTPFVILAYLLSIPAMIHLLEKIVDALIADTEITIPITLSFQHAMIGLVGLLLAYYIAIALAKRVLNKVPLAVALKESRWTMSLIKTENLTKTYKLGALETHALKDINLEIEEGEIVVILGPSGSGKTTLLNLLSGLDKKTSGKIFYEGKDISKYSDARLTRFRKKNLGFIFQTYNLLEHLNVEENILVGKKLGKKGLDVKEIMKTVGLSKHAKKSMYQLSGGEQQRVSIARALVKNPKVMFCDEPTGALDEKTGKIVLTSLIEANEKYNTTMIIITHNPGIALIGDRVLRMNSGDIISEEKNKTRMDPKEIPWG